MEYVKPILSLAGTAQAMVLGELPGNGDNQPATSDDTKAPLIGLGLDD